MDCIATRIPYRQTNYFNKLVLDYIDQAAALQPLYQHAVSISGIQKAIESRMQFATDRKTLVAELKKQYEGVNTSDKVLSNVEALLSEKCFTITTAHQTNIFTGPLYFIYKILHAIRLADHLKTSFPDLHFVPVFYIGSEDADLEELNHIWLGGEKLIWETKQTGAVGRMQIDKSLLQLIDRMEGQLKVLPHGNEIIGLIKKSYTAGVTIQDATFRFVNDLFAEYGLVVLLPDNVALKSSMKEIFKDDLKNQTAAAIVEQSGKLLTDAGYKVQAHAREINLFYLKDNIRERIIEHDNNYRVANTDIQFDHPALLKELDELPERFSPNVILRGLYQETILPDIAFIGGGGETAYWLQLKELFAHYKVPFPVLVLRNSFLIAENKWVKKAGKLNLSLEQFFEPEQEILKRLVKSRSEQNLSLDAAAQNLSLNFDNIKKQSVSIDKSLEQHVEALKTRAVHKLKELEKKMLRAEKRKFEAQQHQIAQIKSAIFPSGGLQERKDNFSYYYALWGSDFIKSIYNNSLSLEQEFVVITESHPG